MSSKKVSKQPDAGKLVPPVEIDVVKVGSLLHNIAVIVKNTLYRYWFSPADAVSAITDCHGRLKDFLKVHEYMNVRVVSGILMVNGQTIETSTPEMRILIEHLRNLEIDNFSISANVTRDEFAIFFDILSNQPGDLRKMGGFHAALEDSHIKQIQTKKLVFKEIAEEEMVVSKKDYDGKGEGVSGDGQTGGILAFLKGDVSVKDESVAQAAREMASDPEKMAQLILQAAEIRQKTDSQGGETLVDFVVGCLRRTYQAIKEDSSYNTQKGKKKVTRDIILLEEQILNRMREMSLPELKEDDLSAIADATEEMTDEIKMDALADEYMTKLNVAQESQSKIVELIRGGSQKGGEESILQKKLADRGLSPSGWHELVVRSGIGGGEVAGFAISHVTEAIGHLDKLLDTMEKEFAREQKPPVETQAQAMLNVLQEVNNEIKSLTIKTGLRIEDLMECLKSDTDVITDAENKARDAGKNLVLTRSQMLLTISQILREISEPLDLIRSALDMVNSRIFDKTPEHKVSVLRVMVENAERVKGLIDNLRHIAGVEHKS